MKKQRGRPKTLLARMSDETRDEICNAINYGSRAWRLIRIRNLLSEGKGLRPDYLSAGWTEIGKQVEQRAAAAQRFLAKNKGKLPTPEEDSRFEAASLWREREVLSGAREVFRARIVSPPRRSRSKWVDAAVLWHELMQQFESALVIGNVDFLDELAKAIRGQAEPEPNAEFTREVLVLLQKKAGATASDIFAALKSDGLVEKQPDGTLAVAGRPFENKQRALDAIHDIAKKVSRELARSAARSRSMPNFAVHGLEKSDSF